jgi:hypothetical protein
MNVRNDPLKQGGIMTTARSDSNRFDFYEGPKSGAWGAQNYVKPMFTDLNPYKGIQNQLDLGVAQRQLAGNPFAHSFSG